MYCDRLTTDQCNYHCSYCHNEGQKQGEGSRDLAFDDFCMIMQAIEPLGIDKIIFSGGEPLINPEKVRMIEWLDSNTDYEVCLATNGSLITEETAQKLGQTKASVTMQYPAADDAGYKQITGHSSEAFYDSIRLLDKYGVSNSFNFVLYPDIMENLDAERDLTIWTFGNGGQVKLLQSPCYDHRIDLCRKHGELRLLPDMSLQKCIFDLSSVSLKGLSVEEIRKTISDMWVSFERCIQG